ncbi:hypothetical protein BRD17_02495 [Halobacteriales archaeon SW_7_68_16]|nr:MAG: hypothetical protein BRD17_02495 [Halobacteriales archaeon SW_7_68_16]
MATTYLLTGPEGAALGYVTDDPLTCVYDGDDPETVRAIAVRVRDLGTTRPVADPTTVDVDDLLKPPDEVPDDAPVVDLDAEADDGAGGDTDEDVTGTRSGGADDAGSDPTGPIPADGVEARDRLTDDLARVSAPDRLKARKLARAIAFCLPARVDRVTDVEAAETARDAVDVDPLLRAEPVDGGRPYRRERAERLAATRDEGTEEMMTAIDEATDFDLPATAPVVDPDREPGEFSVEEAVLWLRDERPVGPAPVVDAGYDHDLLRIEPLVTAGWQTVAIDGSLDDLSMTIVTDRHAPVLAYEPLWGIVGLYAGAIGGDTGRIGDGYRVDDLGERGIAFGYHGVSITTTRERLCGAVESVLTTIFAELDAVDPETRETALAAIDVVDGLSLPDLYDDLADG